MNMVLVEQKTLEALLDVENKARCIRHWHDAMRDGSGMVVSRDAVFRLWEAISEYDKTYKNLLDK